MYQQALSDPSNLYKAELYENYLTAQAQSQQLHYGIESSKTDKKNLREDQIGAQPKPLEENYGEQEIEQINEQQQYVTQNCNRINDILAKIQQNYVD
jgi:hypothetical protein